MSESRDFFEADILKYAKLNKLDIEYSKPLSECSSFKIGGIADYVIYPFDTDALQKVVKKAIQYEIPYEVIGRGSNILFSDNGFNGAIISTVKMNNFMIYDNVISAYAGMSITQLAREAQKKGLSGLEFAYGIPGSCGGAVYMNAGAYGGEIKDCIEQSTYFDADNSTVDIITLAQHDFGYRHSIYTNSNKIILSIHFKMKEDDPALIKERMDANMSARISKQPLEYPSAGSVFKRYPGYYTAKIIEECGLKGKRIGGAQVSEKHAGFIINLGGATACDVLSLIDHIKETIYKAYNINIETEIRYI